MTETDTATGSTSLDPTGASVPDYEAVGAYPLNGLTTPDASSGDVGTGSTLEHVRGEVGISARDAAVSGDLVGQCQ